MHVTPAAARACACATASARVVADTRPFTTTAPVPAWYCESAPRLPFRALPEAAAGVLLLAVLVLLLSALILLALLGVLVLGACRACPPVAYSCSRLGRSVLWAAARADSSAASKPNLQTVCVAW
mgnify:CR=1 FL=1